MRTASTPCDLRHTISFELWFNVPSLSLFMSLSLGFRSVFRSFVLYCPLAPNVVNRNPGNTFAMYSWSLATSLAVVMVAYKRAGVAPLASTSLGVGMLAIFF